MEFQNFYQFFLYRGLKNAMKSSSGLNTKKFISHLVNKQTIISLPFSKEMTFIDRYMYIHVLSYIFKHLKKIHLFFYCRKTVLSPFKFLQLYLFFDNPYLIQQLLLKINLIIIKSTMCKILLMYNIAQPRSVLFYSLHTTLHSSEESVILEQS